MKRHTPHFRTLSCTCCAAIPPQLVLHVLYRSRVCGSRVHLKKKEKEKEKKKKKKKQNQKENSCALSQVPYLDFPRLSDDEWWWWWWMMMMMIQKGSLLSHTSPWNLLPPTNSQRAREWHYTPMIPLGGEGGALTYMSTVF